MRARTYVCNSCGKRFYFFGRLADTFNQLVGIKRTLSMYGYESVALPWKLIEANAKCCDNPVIEREA